jgi:hypothetical protein
MSISDTHPKRNEVPMTRTELLAVLSFVTATALPGCGGSSSSSSPPPHVSAPVAAATGGTVTLPGGAAVQIPAAALASDTTITIQQTTSAPTGTVGPAFDLGPSGTTFSQPVTVTIPVPAGTTDAAIWTKPAGAAHYTSLPTTVSGGVATAQASHFSVFLVGPVDLTGTWAGQVDYSYANTNGTSGTGSTMHVRDVVQDVGDVTVSYGNAAGVTATCSGTVSAAVLNMTCTRLNLDGTCTAQYDETGNVSGNTWILGNSFQWTGTSCASAGQVTHVLNSPITRRTGPGRNLAGSYARSSTYTMTGPGKNPLQGSGSGTSVRTQPAGSSLVHNDVTMDSGTTHTCKGVVVSDLLYASCYGYNAGRTIRYNSTAQATITAGPPFDVDGVTTTTIVGDPSGYTNMTGTVHDVRQ